jgi:molybdate transport system substrate-binding protein
VTIRFAIFAATFVSFSLPEFAAADEVTVAVAANFSGALTEIVAEFERQTTHKVVQVTGSTGQLYAQILNGAPYDVFLAADRQRPSMLTESGQAIPDSQFTYAIGALVLWSSDEELLRGASLDILDHAVVRHVAIANPALAPYGAAARAVLERNSLWDRLSGKIAFGQSVGQAYAMVATGNAEAGFVALSQVLGKPMPGSLLVLAAGAYPPIRQDAVVLKRGKDNEAARAFTEFLKSPATTSALQKFGYSAPLNFSRRNF